MSDERHRIGNGVLLIVIGGLFLLNQQGIGGFGHLWPLILIAIGVVSLAFPKDDGRWVDGPDGRRVRRGRSSGGFWLIAVGVIFLLDQNRIFEISRSWPLFIVAAGLAMIFSRRRADGSAGGPTGGQS